MKPQNLEEIKKQEAKNGRFSGNIVLQSSDEFSGQIDTQTLSKIEVTYDAEYEEKVRQREKPKQFIERSGENGTATVLSDVIAHEINHRGYGDCNGCPGKGGEEGYKIYLDSFIEPISKVLKPKGYSLQDFHNFANQLEDLIENTELKHTAKRNNSGLVLFYENSASTHGLTPQFDAFLRTQMVCWGSSEQAKMLYDYSQGEEKVLEVKKEFLRRIGFDGKSRKRLAEILKNPENWKNIAEIFAEEFSKLTSPGNTFIPVIGAQDFERETKDKDVLAKYVYGKYAAEGEKPSFINPEDSLILLYEQLAKRLEIKVESQTVSDKMPLVHYGKRILNPEKDKFQRIRLGLNRQGDLELRTTKFSMDYPIEIKQTPKGFPEFRVAFMDSSESTRHSPSCNGCQGYSCNGSKEFIPWGDKSIYHYENLAVFGIFEFLKQNNLLRKETFNAGVFSSGFRKGRNLEESKKLLMQPEFGGTLLFKEGIDSVFLGSGNLVYTMGDGEVANWNQKLRENRESKELDSTTKEYFSEKAKNHYYFHLHFGVPNQFTRDLEIQGLPVFYMTDGDEFVRRAIDLTRGLYRSQK